MSSFPPLPPGFVLERAADRPPPPPGFVLEGTSGPAIDVRPNLSSVPLVGPALGAAGFDGVPRADVAPDSWEEPGVLLPIQKNTQTGAVRPAVPLIVESLLDAIRAPGDALAGKMSHVEVDPETGAVAPFNSEMIERSANAAGWMTGGAPGAKVEVLNAAGRRLPVPIVRAANADGVPLGSVAGLTDQLGAEAVVADLGPNLRAQAAALAERPGSAGDVLIDRMSARHARGNTRVRQGLDDTIGAAPIPSRLHDDIRAGQRSLGPDYDRVLAGAEPVDASQLAETLDGQVQALRGRAQLALLDVRRMLDNIETGELETSAAVLFQVRQAIDGMVGAEADANVVRVLRTARQTVNDLLVEAAPGIRDVDGQYRELARQSEAVDTGQRVLDSGRDAPRPAEVADAVAAGVQPQGTLVGPSGAAFRLSQGARAELDRVVGTNANDRAALDRLLKGDGDWNRQRLVTLFGRDRGQRLFDLIANEARLAETENAVLQAGGRRPGVAARGEVSPDRRGPGVVQEAMNLRPGSAAAKAVDNVIGGHREQSQSIANDAMLAELLGRGNWQVRDARPISQMPVPVESWLAELFGRSSEPEPRQSKPDADILRLLM